MTIDITTKKSHILVVDDEPDMCHICARALQSRGYEVTAVTNASLAPDLIVQGNYDLLLTDLKMPGISGLDLALMALKRDPTAAVVMMTAFASYEHLHKAMQNGISDFLSKPFDLSQLMLAVSHALNRRLLIHDNVRLRALEALRIDSEILNSTLDYNLLVQYVLDLAVRWSTWPAAVLLIGEAQTPLTSVTFFDNQWQLSVRGMEFAHRALSGGTLLTSHGEMFAHAQHVIHTAMAIPMSWGGLQGVLMIGTHDTNPNIPTVTELMTLLSGQSVAALRNAEMYGEMSNLYRRQRQIEVMKDEFIAIASHELRTPLTMVLGYSDMLMRTIQGDNQTHIKEIHSNALRMREVIDHMSQLQKTSLDNDLQLTTIDISVVVHQVISQINERFPSIKIRLFSDDVATHPFISDVQWLRVIIVQLLSNAATYAQRDIIDLSMQYQYPAFAPVPLASDSQQWLTITVSDQGVGINMREQWNVFTSFVQVDDSLTRSHGGVGVGLALIYDMVRRLGGFVMMSSKVGVGSTFVVMVPGYQQESTGE
jgi:signal transduction histidine kinase